MLPTTWVPKDLLTFLLSNSCLFSILAFLTEIIFSCTVSRVPEDENDSSATVVAEFWLLSWSFTTVKVFTPVSNLGWFTLFGFGIKKLPIKIADKSDTNLTFVIFALAPLVSPIKVIPDSTYPLYWPCAWLEREKVSTFNIVDVDEYAAESGWFVYGLFTKVDVGIL